jgi:nucleotide-binding universal stress UspA family protein
VRRAHVLAPARINLLVLSGENRQPDGAGEYARLLALRLGESVQRFPPAGPILAEERTAPGRGAAAVEPESLEILAVDPAQHGALPLPVLDHREPRHLLVVRPAGKTPSPPARILVCIAVGEPGKVTVRMAERLAWRLQAEVTVLTVLSSEDRGSVPEYVAHFLEASVRDLASRGVEAHPVIRRGATTAEILSQCEEGGHDLLIVGAPVAPRTPPAPGRRAPRLTGVVGRLVGASPCPVLVVQCTERT